MADARGVLETRQSDPKHRQRGGGRRGGRGRGVGGRRQRDEFHGEQVISLPFPIALVKNKFGGNSLIVWPLNQPRYQPFFVGKLNETDKCVDIFCPASVQCLYLMGYFGKGSLSRNAPIYKLKRMNLSDNPGTRPASQPRGQGRRGEKKQGRGNFRGNHGRGGNQQDNFGGRGHRGNQFGCQRGRGGQSGPVAGRLGRKNTTSQNNQELRQWLSLKAAFPEANMNLDTLVDQLYGDNSTEATNLQMELLADGQTSSADISGALGMSSSASNYSSDSECGSQASDSSVGSKTDQNLPRRQEILKLGLEEAFFLSYGLGLLTVTTATDDNSKLNIDQMWSTFRQMHNDKDLEEFAILYGSYHFFRSRGWVVKSGLKFGCELMLYKEGPPFFHALLSMTVIKIREGEPSTREQGQIVEPTLDWPYLVGYHRLSRGVLKQPVMCYVQIPKEITAEDFKLPNVIEKMTIETVLMERWQPGHETDRCRKSGEDGHSD